MFGTLGARVAPLLDATTTVARLLPGARTVVIGDSIAQGLGSATTTNSYNTINSLYDWANVYAEGRAYFPAGANKGVGGQSIDTIEGRFTTDLAPFQPQVIIANGGYNDTTSKTAAAILAKWDSMIAQAAAMRAYLIVVPITPGTTQTGAADVVRLAVNAGLAARASASVFVVDIGGYNPAIHNYAEALPPVGYRTHPNVLGCQLLGPRIAAVLKALIQPRDPGLRSDDALNKLGVLGGMPGAAGTKTIGASTSMTGSVATGWTVDGTNSGGASVVASKVRRGDGTDFQQIALSGTYSGSAKVVTLTTGSAALAGVAAGDPVEVTYDLEFDGGGVNVDGFGLFAFMQSSGYAFLSQVAHMTTNTANNSGAIEPGAFSGTFRAMAFGSPSTAPAFINITFSAYLREGAAAGTAVAATIRVGRVAVRKL